MLDTTIENMYSDRKGIVCVNVTWTVSYLFRRRRKSLCKCYTGWNICMKKEEMFM